MMPSGALVKPRESMDRTSKGRNCSGPLGPKIKDVLSMIESHSWQCSHLMTKAMTYGKKW